MTEPISEIPTFEEWKAIRAKRRARTNRLLLLALLLTAISVLLLWGWLSVAHGAMPDGPGIDDRPGVEVVGSAPASCQIMGILREPLELSSDRQAWMYHVFCVASQ